MGAGCLAGFLERNAPFARERGRRGGSQDAITATEGDVSINLSSTGCITSIGWNLGSSLFLVMLSEHAARVAPVCNITTLRSLRGVNRALTRMSCRYRSVS